MLPLGRRQKAVDSSSPFKPCGPRLQESSTRISSGLGRWSVLEGWQLDPGRGRAITHPLLLACRLLVDEAVLEARLWADTFSSALEMYSGPTVTRMATVLGPVKRRASMLTSIVVDSRGSRKSLVAVAVAQPQPLFNCVISMRTA